MNDLTTRLMEAASTTDSEPDMDAAVRRARGMRRHRLSAVACSIVIVLAGSAFGLTWLTRDGPQPTVRVVTTPTGWKTFATPDGSVTVRYPPDWQLAGTNLMPNLGDPAEILALATFAMTPSDHNCAQFPVNSLEAMGPTDALIWVTERRGGLGIAAYDLGPRPPTFGPTSGTDALQGELPDCINHPLAGTASTITFDDHGRHFYLDFAIGSQVAPERRAQVFDILNSFTVK
jgi:hypothetical protein